jgi:hypothetical protein
MIRLLALVSVVALVYVTAIGLFVLKGNQLLEDPYAPLPWSLIPKQHLLRKYCGGLLLVSVGGLRHSLKPR